MLLYFFIMQLEQMMVPEWCMQNILNPWERCDLK